MTDATIPSEKRSVLSRLADMLFGGASTSSAEIIPSEMVALTLSFPGGRREIFWTRSEPGRSVLEQIDEIFVSAYATVRDGDGSLVDLSLTDEPTRRWVVDFREPGAFASRLAVMANDEQDAELRGRFAVVTRGMPAVSIEDLFLLHEIAERMMSVSIGSIVEEPVSFEEFRAATDRFVGGLREGRTPEKAGLAGIEEILARFDRVA